MPDTITVIVPTFNEEDNVRECLESVAWADDIFVVDSFSTDRTVEIARELTDHIVQHEYLSHAAQRNWAIPQPATDWVMLLDADERVTPELRARIQDILTNGTECQGFRIRRRTIFFGKLIEHCGWHRDYVVRLWRRGKAHYADREHPHTHAEIDGKVDTLREHLLHNTYRSFDDYLEKFGRYSTWSANDLYKRGRRASWVNLTLRPLWRFFRMYVLRHGFLDGKHGLILCALAAYSVLMKYAKLWDMYRHDALGETPPPAVKEKAAEEVARLTES